MKNIGQQLRGCLYLFERVRARGRGRTTITACQVTPCKVDTLLFNHTVICCVLILSRNRENTDRIDVLPFEIDSLTPVNVVEVC